MNQHFLLYTTDGYLKIRMSRIMNEVFRKLLLYNYQTRRVIYEEMLLEF